MAHGRGRNRVGRRGGVEWPTLILALVIYGGWGILTWYSAALPLPLLLLLGTWLLAWHSSLQHEVLHGHPTRRQAINDAIGFLPLSLYLPYARYRTLHLAHHRDARLTDPLEDPESYYWTAEQWHRLGALGRAITRANATLLGRLLIGPPWMIGRFLHRELIDLRRDLPGRRRQWAVHLVGVAAVLIWVVGICDVNPALYVAGMVLPGVALVQLRAFAEHRAAGPVRHRTAIVDGAPLLGLLFLFNNLHAVHHLRPGLAWYALPGWYHAHRERLVRLNGGLVYPGYFELFRRFLLRRHDVPVHPREPQPAEGTARLVPARTLAG